jgi:hypothetical protein
MAGINEASAPINKPTQIKYTSCGTAVNPVNFACEDSWYTPITSSATCPINRPKHAPMRVTRIPSNITRKNSFDFEAPKTAHNGQIVLPFFHGIIQADKNTQCRYRP